MINLLPTSEKREILAGRTNRLLVRYIFLLIVVMVMTLAAFGFVWYYLETTRSTSQAKIEENEANTRQLLSQKQAIAEFKTNLKTAKTVLDKQVSYSTIVLRVASTIPDGVVLNQLTLDPTTVGKPTVITARARTEAALLKFKDVFAGSPYYSDAQFGTITNTEVSSDKYPYQITMTVTFTKELFQ